MSPEEFEAFRATAEGTFRAFDALAQLEHERGTERVYRCSNCLQPMTRFHAFCYRCEPAR